MTDYIFEGQVIKLNATHYYKWADMYKNLDLTAELIQMDEEFQIRKIEGETMKKWFSECYSRLNGRNKIAGRNRSYAKPQQKSIEEQLVDHDWAKDAKPLKLTN